MQYVSSKSPAHCVLFPQEVCLLNNYHEYTEYMVIKSLTLNDLSGNGLVPPFSDFCERSEIFHRIFCVSGFLREQNNVWVWVDQSDP